MTQADSVSVMIRLERTGCIDSDVVGLLGRQFGQLHAKPSEMKPGHPFVEVFRQNIDLLLIFLRAAPKLHLRKHLVGEARGHDETGVSGRVAQIEQTPLRKEYDPSTGRHFDHVDLILDVRPFVVPERRNLNLVVEMADVADDGHVLHLPDVVEPDDVLVPGRRDEDVCSGRDVLQ